MCFIAVCNTLGDSIKLINMNSNIVKDIPLGIEGRPVGPHGLIKYNEMLITANNFNNSISFIDLKNKKEIESFFVGYHPNSVQIINGKLYICCGESSSLLIFDLETKKIELELKTESYPHSMAYSKLNNSLYISNMDSHSISLVDCNENTIKNRIIAREYPTKILTSKDEKYLFICESYLGYDIDGYINIISLKDFKSIGRVRVGITPIDLCEDNGMLFVSNFTEGSISIVDINKMKEINKINVSGMPKGIVKYNERIYVGDYMKGVVKVVDLKEEIIKNIPIGREPNDMLLIK